MADSILRNKANEFAKNIVYLCRKMKTEHKEAILVNQLLRSATSIGANIYEAQYSQSVADFICKFEIAQKECFETEYWLDLLFATECLDEQSFEKSKGECLEIRKMLISSMKTVKVNKGIT